jgi:hypothetical protein
MSERYTTPAEGSLDWHVPLNKNFERLATDVEFRDAESNRDQYQPSERAKFLSTDTGAIYIGDGNQWNYLGDIVPEQSGTGGGGGGGASVVAPPGGVQAAIDEVAAAGGGKVRLDPRRRYEQPSVPWQVEEDVILDFDGAFVYGTGDLNGTDVVHIHPGGQLHSPRIDLHDGGDGYTMANSYRGRVFTLDTDKGRYFSYGTAIRNGLITAVGETGTGCYLGVNRESTWITHLDLNFDVGTPKGSTEEASLDTALHMDTTGAGEDGWINGVRVGGHWRYVGTGVLQTGGTGRYNQQVLNEFRVQVQPGGGSNAFWQIKDPTWARLNTWWGIIWDYRDYGQYAWKIDSQYRDADKPWRACTRNAVNTPDLPVEYVRNRSPSNHFVNRTDRFETTVV